MTRIHRQHESPDRDNPRDALAADLNDLLAAEMRGLAQHLDTAEPYLTAATYSLWGRLRPMADVSREHTRLITGLLNDLDLPIRPVCYDPAVARFHDTSLDVLLPRLIEHKQRQIAACKRTLRRPALPPSAVEVLTAILNDHQTQLSQLEAAKGS
jgi:hypothetical protein